MSYGYPNESFNNATSAQITCFPFLQSNSLYMFLTLDDKEKLFEQAYSIVEVEVDCLLSTMLFAHFFLYIIIHKT